MFVLRWGIKRRVRFGPYGAREKDLWSSGERIEEGSCVCGGGSDEATEASALAFLLNSFSAVFIREVRSMEGRAPGALPKARG